MSSHQPTQQVHSLVIYWGRLGGRFTYSASRLQDNCLAVEDREGYSRTPSKVRGLCWEMPAGGRREEGEEEGKGGKGE